ncbi:hypothetical protein KAJ83_19040 [Marivibrio halodurans]|uniref:Uncharacterized protein n=1 Tax=Marivibrio halodurans TaxID=2039722 RepID=A0A8J7S5Z2_9PROT|nr:hypothetical protein [Marivibrio halodurans]MBP5859123.1 hypothetical protein [Marivibrio halodurans]
MARSGFRDKKRRKDKQGFIVVACVLATSALLLGLYAYVAANRIVTNPDTLYHFALITIHGPIVDIRWT